MCPRMVRAGVKTAYMWYSAGARTLEDVLAGKGGIKMTAQQEIGIRYYDGKSTYLLWVGHEPSRILPRSLDLWLRLMPAFHHHRY